jgi:hypothetical protein
MASSYQSLRMDGGGRDLRGAIHSFGRTSLKAPNEQSDRLGEGRNERLPVENFSARKTSPERKTSPADIHAPLIRRWRRTGNLGHFAYF